MIKVILYTKSGCHLCEDAKFLLQQMQSVHPHELQEVDIRTNQAIHEKYLFEIPVIQLNGGICKAPITAEKLNSLFREA